VRESFDARSGNANVRNTNIAVRGGADTWRGDGGKRFAHLGGRDGAEIALSGFMWNQARIVCLEARPLDIPLRSPFGIAGGAQTRAANALVILELSDGTIGLGEAAPFPAYNGETQEQALRVVADASGAVVGREAGLGNWRQVASAFRTAGGANSGAAQCAFEMALLDALNTRAELPMWKYFGGADHTLETDMTVTTGSPASSAEAARAIRQRGMRTIKVKVGGKAGTAHDLARLRAIHAAAPDADLILDGNAGLSRADAADLVLGLKSAGIAPILLEQWLERDDLRGARELAERSGWRLAADEAARTAEDVARLAEARAAQVVNIKLMKAGVAEALDLAQAARKHGLGLMIGGNVESRLAMTCSACFAAGAGGFEFVDLDTPLFLAEDPFVGGMRYDAARISLGEISAGLGMRLA
jgi:L-alanine-DL-glutamate epimerase-like enolase superfamily enzyme